jgi:hypothetical protein
MTSTSTLPLLLSVGLLGGAVLTSYVVVLGNVGGRFPLPSSPAPPAPSSYWQSPYWLSLPPSTAQGITLLQVAAAGGFLAWMAWLAASGLPQRGLLASPWWTTGLLFVFLLGSLAWPFAAHWMLSGDTSVPRAVAACVPLWAVAVAVLLLVAGTFEAHAPAHAVVGILLLGQVCVLADGVGWAATALYRAAHPSADLR